MCGRVYVPEPADSPEELEELLNELIKKQQKRYPDFALKRGELKPGDTAAVIAPDQNRKRSVFPMKWGFLVPKPAAPAAGVQLRMDELLPDLPPQESSGRRVFNARSESALQKPLFADSMRNRRCIVPAQCYFEWDHRHEPMDKYRFFDPASPVIWLAGLYRVVDRKPEFTILTREAADGIEDFHDRMPVIAPPDLLEAWLDPKVPSSVLLGHAVTRLNWEKA